jgi:glutaredoxin 3
MTEGRTATLVRMVLPDHICPYGVRAKELLEAHGFKVDERILRSRDEVDAYKAEHEVGTTPQIFIGDERIGGCDALEEHLGSGA